MELGEDKAKEILDFLARDAGYCKLSIKCRYGPDKSKHFFIACKHCIKACSF